MAVSTSDIRAEWLAVLERHRDGTWARPDGDRYWSARLDTASRDALRAIQSEKLRVAVRYAYACIPFYRRKFDAIGLHPADIGSVDDLQKIPVTTKQEMADDIAAHPPWGTYTAVDDATWRESGWQIFASSGTTARPRVFRYTAFDRSLWRWANARAMWAMGFRPGRDSALLAFGYGPHAWLWCVHYALNPMGRMIGDGGVVRSPARRVGFIEDGAGWLAFWPSRALELGDLLAALVLDLAARAVGYLFCAGEAGFSVPATRRRLEELW